MTSRSEALSKFQVPKSARLLSATQLPLYALISRARKNGGGHMGSGLCPILPPRPTGSITGYGATQFNCIAEPIPLKRKRKKSKSNSARLVGLSAIGQCLKDQYDALASPVPPHLAALVEQLKTQK
jgi:hypothetical protein